MNDLIYIARSYICIFYKYSFFYNNNISCHTSPFYTLDHDILQFSVKYILGNEAKNVSALIVEHLL